MTDQTANIAFIRGELEERRDPPGSTVGAIGWVRQNLISSIPNTLLTLVSIYLMWVILPPLIRFLIIDAVWDGAGRADCLEETLHRPVGACWPFVTAKIGQFIYGFYPIDQRWRVNITFLLGVALLVPLLVPTLPGKRENAIAFFGVFPVVAFFLLVGGGFTGLEHVETRQWGGLLVTLVVAVTGIVVSLPLGIVLALGRRSQLPIIRFMSVIFIEFWRGVPLITVLFFATYMLPLFMPSNWTIDGLLRALVGVALFSAAYMAEVIRGGLQAIPKGQYEGAIAMGLGYWQMMGLIVLPQSLRISIPALVNSFIGLFMDTTLVSMVGLYDFLNMVKTGAKDQNWLGADMTGYVFCAIVYWVCCFGMSRYSMYLERKLHTGHKKR